MPKGDSDSLQPFINSRYAVAQLFCLSSFLTYSFLAAIMAGMAIIRDDEAQVSELLHSTPLTASEYTVGKFMGVLVAMVSLELRPLGHPTMLRGPFRLANYFLPVLAFAGPSIWVSAGIAFAVGERTWRPMRVYAVPTGLLMATIFIFIPTRAPGDRSGRAGLAARSRPGGG